MSRTKYHVLATLESGEYLQEIHESFLAALIAARNLVHEASGGGLVVSAIPDRCDWRVTDIRHHGSTEVARVQVIPQEN